MLTRIISGVWYIGILALAYCLKIFLPYGEFYFDVLIYAFTLIGTFEMVRALKEKTTKAERVIVYGFAVVCVPVCVVTNVLFGWGMIAVGVCTTTLAIALLSLLVFRHEETTLENLGLSLLSAVYPTYFLALLVMTNHATAPVGLEKFGFDSRILILFVFVITPCVDSFAYLFGKFLKKYFPKKMAPVISPNKTVVGCIGGMIGGLLASVGLYFAYNAIAGSFDQMGIWLPVYLAIGFSTSVATEFGDLVESCIKRKLGLKDMGNLMPGHGGALDRLDSSLFAVIVVYGTFALISMIV